MTEGREKYTMCLHPNIRALTNPRAPGSSQPGNLQNDIVLA